MSANTIISNELVDTFLKNRSCGFFCNSTIPTCRRIKDAPGLQRRCKPFGLGEPVALRKALKISPPILAHRFRIPQVILVKRFHKFQTDAIGKFLLAHKERISVGRYFERGTDQGLPSQQNPEDSVPNTWFSCNLLPNGRY